MTLVEKLTLMAFRDQHPRLQVLRVVRTHGPDGTFLVVEYVEGGEPRGVWLPVDERP